MKAIARRRRSGTYQHDLKVRDHVVNADEPREAGGDDNAPSPQEYLAVSLASWFGVLYFGRMLPFLGGAF